MMPREDTEKLKILSAFKDEFVRKRIDEKIKNAQA